MMRILRVYRLVRHFAGLQSLFFTLQQAFNDHPTSSLKIIQQLKSVAAQFLVDLLLFLSGTQAYKELGLLFILVAVAILTFSRFDLDLDLQQLSQ